MGEEMNTATLDIYLSHLEICVLVVFGVMSIRVVFYSIVCAARAD